MMENKHLIDVFNDTQKMLGYSLYQEKVKYSVETTEFYPEDIDILPDLKINAGDHFPRNVYVEDNDTVETALNVYNGKKMALLNFANAYHPGGGVLRGAIAQEEDLCRATSLYPVLNCKENRSRFYDKHLMHRSAYGTSDILYSPGIIILKVKELDYELLPKEEMIQVDVITCAAPQFNHKLDDDAPDIVKERLRQAHINRGKRIIECAVKNEVEVLILGAFGCGAFNNDPHIVASAYRELMLAYSHYFDRVEFAIYCRENERTNYDVFREIILP
ncbi:MAG: TIGR02452 family protein [Lachnospiraceae bacterium]|nr:TIGR02452 family protein [Lachnospiraceae bacterium]